MIGFDIDPRIPVHGLGVAQQQMVEIALKVLSQDARILVMDEADGGPLSWRDRTTVRNDRPIEEKWCCNNLHIASSIRGVCSRGSNNSPP